jgi:hypothetical protein
MDDAVAERLVLSLLEWVANGERSYEEVMDAWRTSCPRLPVLGGMRMIAGLSEQEDVNGRCIVRITSSGLALLEQRWPSPRLEHARWPGKSSLGGGSRTLQPSAPLWA